MADEAYAIFQQDFVQERALLLETLRRQSQLNAMRTGISPTQVAAATAIAQYYPTAPGAVVAPLGMMMADPEDPTVQGVMGLVEEDNGGITDWLGRTMGSVFLWAADKAENVFGDKAQAFARGTLLAFDALWNEVVARPYRTIVGTMQQAGLDPGILAFGSPTQYKPESYEGFSFDKLGSALGNIGETYEQAGSSAGVRALQTLGAGQNVNIGSGILPVSQLAEETSEYQALITSGVDPETARQQIQRQLGAPLTHQAEQQRETGITYNGLSVTPGRVFASQWLDPETEPFNLLSGLLDAGINIWADPAAAGIKALSSTRNAYKVFNGAALGRVMGPSADDWLRSTFPGRGQAVAHHIADNLNTYQDVQRALPEVTDRGLLADLAATNDPALITSRLREEIVTNRNIRKVPRNRRIRNAARSKAQETRIGKLLDETPGRRLNIEDLDEGIRSLDEMMVLAEFDGATRNDFLMRLARLENSDHPGVSAVYFDVLDRLGAGLIDELPARLHGFARPIDLATMQTSITDVFKSVDEMRQYFNRIYDDPLYWAGSEVDHLGKPIQTAHLMTEYLQRSLPLPDPRQLRRIVSATHPEGRFTQRVLNLGFNLDSKVFGSTALDRGAIITAATDVAIQKVWKPAVLLRLAWTLRVVGEEQLRTAAHGFDSMFKHPIQYLGWIAEQQRLGGIVGGKGGTVAVKRLVRSQGDDIYDEVGNLIKGKVSYTEVEDVIDVARGNKDVFGSIMEAEQHHIAAMTTRHGGWLDIAPGDMFRSAWVPIRKHQSGFAHGWARSLSHIWNDEVSVHVLTQGRKATVDWLETGGGQTILEKFIRTGGGEKQALLRTREGIEGYVDSVWARAQGYAGAHISGPATKQEWLNGKRYMIDAGSQANQEILDLLATGHYKGHNLRGIDEIDDWDKIVKVLEPLTEHLPEDFITKSPLSALPGGRRIESRWDNGIARGFELLMTRPTNKFSRSPAFRQFYWQRMTEMISYMDDEMADFAIKAAGEAGMPAQTLKDMATRRLDRAGRSAAQEGLEDLTFTTKGGTLKLDDVMGEADQVAKFFALKETENLLYTLTKRHGVNDVLRNILPFGEAWFEIMTTWGRLITEHPQIIRRGQQVIEGARESGYLERDGITGEEVFNFPGSGAMNALLFGGAAAEAGARVNPIGFVAGLNLAAGQYHPGLGPVVQVPSAWLLSKHEEWDWFQKLANPFGVKEIDSPGDVLNQAMPAWAQKIASAIGGGEGTQSWRTMQESTAIDIARVLAYSGEYDMNNPEDVEKVKDKAKSSARWFSLIRGAVQFAAPTGVSLRYDVKTAGDDGRWWGIGVLADEYTNMVEKLDGDETQALAQFIATFGLNPIELVTSKTRAITPHHLTEEGSVWARQHPDITSDYPLTAFFVAPDEVEDEFSWEAWNHALATGTRETRTVEQWLQAANDTKGRLIYEAQRIKLEDAELLNTDVGRSYLRDLRAYLIETYDGYKREIVGEAQKASTDDMLLELREMIDDPRLQRYSAVQGIQVFLQRWDEIGEVYMDVFDGGAPNGWLTAEKGAPLRANIRQVAEWLMEQDQYSGFNAVWSRVFKRLVEEENLSPVDLSLLGL